MSQPSPTPTVRNHLIDLARIASVVIVVVFHTLLWVISLRDSRISVDPWAPGPGWWFASWFFASIPVFFLAAGFANTVIVDGSRARGITWSRYLVERGTRLAGPLTLFMAVFALVSSLPAWFGALDPAVSLSRQFAQLLWFLVVYLGLLLTAPVLVAAFDRFGGWSLLPLVALAVGVDVIVRHTGQFEWQWLNLAVIWPLAHHWGVAYHRGWFRGWPVWGSLLVLVGCAALLVAMVFGLGYPPAAVAWADILVANLQPPTVAVLVLGLAQASALGLAERFGLARSLPTRLVGPVHVANALLFTVYLWHIPVIVLAGSLLAGGSLLWPAAAGLLLSQPVFLVLVLTVTVGLVPQIGRLEWRLIPQVAAEAPGRGLAPVAFVVLWAGVAAVWKCGAVVHPGALASTVSVVLLFVGITLVAGAARSPLDTTV
ncbi:MAG: acyltransferase [Propionibacteriaceae bacterium]|nr:acyltransferase [Propionibacteriaceae bacterium]